MGLIDIILKRIPAEYADFPNPGFKISTISTKKYKNYKRCILDYKNIDDIDFNDYIAKISMAGFKQATDVRYDRLNEYIIVERDNRNLHLVFHIKH